MILICIGNAFSLVSVQGADMSTAFVSHHGVTNVTSVNQKTTRLAYQKTRKEVREEDPRCRPKSTSHITRGMGNNNFQIVFKLGCSVS